MLIKYVSFLWQQFEIDESVTTHSSIISGETINCIALQVCELGRRNNWVRRRPTWGLKFREIEEVFPCIQHVADPSQPGNVVNIFSICNSDSRATWNFEKKQRRQSLSDQQPKSDHEELQGHKKYRFLGFPRKRWCFDVTRPAESYFRGNGGPANW